MTEVIGHTREVSLLANIRFFACVPPDELEEIAGTLKRRSYQKGEVVYHQEDPPGSLFIVSRGTVKMQLTSPSGKQMTVGWMTEGHFFGTINILSETLRPENAVAVEPCELFVLDREVLRSFLRRHPTAAETLVQVMAGRWRGAIQNIYDLAFLDVPGRLARVLLEFVRRSGADDHATVLLPRYLTQPELASLVGTTRESVNKWLQFFARQGWIDFHHGAIRVTNQEGLRGRVA